MRIFEAIVSLVYPKRCIFCRRGLNNRFDGDVCEACVSELYRDRHFNLPYIDEAFTPFDYEGMVAAAVKRYKFKRMRFMSRPFGRIVAEGISRCNFSFDLITFVPASKGRIRERGFDQSELIAKELAVCLSFPPPLRLLEKTRETERQSSLPGERRSANVLDAYAISKSVNITGKTILLVDDVVTTGATASEAARVLLTHGAAAVYLAAIAKTKHK